MSIDEFRAAAVERGVHTVEIATVDTQGHLRGKRVPLDRFCNSVHRSGVAIADAIFVFDIQNDLVDNEHINMDSGFLDCVLRPDLSTARFFGHRPGFAIVMADVETPEGEPHPHAPRTVLASQVARCSDQGLNPLVATEMEFYITNPDGTPVESFIQYSSLTEQPAVEAVLTDIRFALAAVGIEVESSNFEYGPGQAEVNCGPADAMTTADNTAIYKSITKQVAASHGLLATFMPKPWEDQSGSGMHIHTSLLSADGSNVFAECDGVPSGVMESWLAGQLAHAQSMVLLGSPTPNGAKRIRPYTFAPTHVHWGLDNRTVLARCIVEAGSSANRVEYRAAGADANPYLIIAGVLAAGVDGVENGLTPPAMGVGDMYTEPGDSAPLPVAFTDVIAAFDGSELAAQLGSRFSQAFVAIANGEAAQIAEHNPDPDAVNDWERDRYMQFS